jgi:hypothetical protein
MIATAAMMPTNNSGVKNVERINVLFLTLERYSLLIISHVLFMEKV